MSEYEFIDSVWLTFYLKGKVVALYHGLPVVLVHRGRLWLVHLGLNLSGEHVLHPVDGGADLNAQLQGLVLRRRGETGDGGACSFCCLPQASSVLKGIKERIPSRYLMASLPWDFIALLHKLAFCFVSEKNFWRTKIRSFLKNQDKQLRWKATLKVGRRRESRLDWKVSQE